MRTHTISLIGFGLGICLLAGSLIVWSFTKSGVVNNIQTQADQTSFAITSPDNQSITSLDSDSDGLKDWEEALRGTDPKNPDTDGDGTPDGEEVKEGRNPLKKGPDDVLDQKTLSLGNTFNLGVTLPKTTTSSTQKTNTQEEKPSETKDLNVIFGNSIVIAVQTQTNRVPDEMNRLNNLLTTTDDASFTAMQAVADSYTTLADDISALSSPTQASPIKNNLATGYLGVATTLQKIIDTHSIDSSLFESYNAEVTRVQGALLSLVSYFKDERTVFGPDDPGRIFTAY